ncbi:thioredoxin domain-containing protein [Leptospira sp. 2 VSF19]|uniref:Thioredoxin domain-containing protein n=1 Tax=Leptospira soteropolitanensis TaxID=2950025 RepID=A0AAW5VLT3_9LEPT|nr:thioredoxin domain-containing protein [Leptospira soteropolitanensis]MCW7492104.1 thioredoxin domain-containing protein [Leptospira soteropolitanensis]MCW7499686.1 thioredoxin domain-containing protein [Leptospira soteropolitanensis]MCW7521937.1 thioredoxin domain-containing protein [Leptospira soteropolitanensis]MCW7525791.1 thioredoxin domain-containing protein [Leptospira soteropolitanensis]MCW7530095.1 thioredoxin domain-containing protein [Leptospira soteropolitanensis]
MSKKPNRLVHEKSPYLLQHAHNPVDWFPWGMEAFEKAQKEDKIILLSIGYSTCHWCHVMERESFEDDSTAEVLNRDFVCIKLDREERPDIDKIYMDALHAMGTQGGWPLNLFLTPTKEPILGGTYFPPENRYGKRSFKEVLRLVSEAWKNQREELLTAASDLTQYLRENETRPNEGKVPGKEIIEKNFERYLQVYDKEFFGFKTNSVNKFPPSMALRFLTEFYLLKKEPRALEMAFNTAYAMKFGGIYDQVGGGICRYATDHEWLVPHFEKMLYDNSLFVEALSVLYRATGEVFFLDVIREIVSYIRRDMTLESGGIASAEDADSEGEEGKFYLWNHSEFNQIVSEEDIQGFWNVTEEGNFEHKNILNVYWRGKNPYIEGIHLTQEFSEKLEKAKDRLLTHRRNRIRPLRDDKILTSWNCLWIRALLNAYEVSGEYEYLNDAKKNYQFICKELVSSDGSILRRFREGEAKYFGTLPDYAEFIWVSFKLFQLEEDMEAYQIGIKSLEYLISNFESKVGPFYESFHGNEDLIVRTIEGYDGVEPSGNSTILHLFHLLHFWGFNKWNLGKKADLIFAYFLPELTQNSLSYPSMISAFQKFQYPSKEVLVVYRDKEALEIQTIKTKLASLKDPNLVWLVIEESKAKALTKELELLSGRGAGSSGILYYVCRNFSCELPKDNWEETLTLIQQ